MTRRLLVSAVASGVLLGAAGCRHKCCSSDEFAPRPFLPAPPPGNIPPAGVPVTPGNSAVPSVAPFGSTLPPAELPPAAPSPAPAPATIPAPAPGGREPLLPDPIPGGPSSRSGYPSMPVVPGVLGGPVKPPTKPTAEPPRAASVLQAPITAPAGGNAGLPGFTKISDGVATGRRPDLDGFATLRQSGYRTVLYLHPPGADVSAVREVVEKRGLTFTAVETTPEKLPAVLDTLRKATADRTATPIYVFDDDGVRAGAVWYLYFRTTGLESADVAKIRARAIGLTGDSDEVKAFRDAIQRFLER